VSLVLLVGITRRTSKTALGFRIYHILFCSTDMTTLELKPIGPPSPILAHPAKWGLGFNKLGLDFLPVGGLLG
jgi:hypothetical protein